MKLVSLSKKMVLIGSLLLAFNTHAYKLVGTVKAWSYMQDSGWTSADGFTDVQMHNRMYQASVIDNYPWTKQFLIRKRGEEEFYLADKTTKTIKLLHSPDFRDASDLDAVYQGEDTGKGCHFAIFDSYARLNFSRAYNEQMAPKLLMVIPENCIDKKQLAAMKAKESARDRQLNEWVAQQSLKELCKKTGNC
jgi:hypothetical protein